MKFYISDISIGMLAIVYLPIVIWMLWKIARSDAVALVVKSILFPLVAGLAYAIPLGDVTMNSIAMSKVCPSAGLNVYKKVQVDGYYDTGSGPRQIEENGYRYIETQKPGGKVARYERQADGHITRTELDAPSAEYEVVYEIRSPVPELGVRSMQRWHVRHRGSGEVVGEWLAFSPMHGWVDRFLLNRWFGAGLPGCDGGVLAKHENWRQQILQPR